ncbi:MAG: endonuclease III [Erysipelotrichia bacterium]|nr:endonuclease III [Erysipelotrichia bacterium]
MNNSEYIYRKLKEMFPQAKCELNYNSPFELLIAVVLSAQTTDKAVNKVTTELFKRYPDAHALANAEESEIQSIIKSIGLYKNKARNIKVLSQKLIETYNGNVPNNQADLVSLPGVGRKTANVVLSELFNYPAFAVDTHVSRISKRLGISDLKDSVTECEKKLCTYFPKEKWREMHHLFIFFGRYKCHSKNPQCADCPFIKMCTYNK